MQDNLENVVTPVEKTIGQFKPKDKFLEFVGIKGNYNFISNEAIIEGKYLSGLDLDDVSFKLTICDEGVNFDEVDTNKTSPEQRERLLEVISDKTITMYNKRMVVQELPFKSVKAISLRGAEEKTIDMWLSVEHKTPISILASFFDDESEVEVSDDQNSKLDALFSLFDEDVVEETQVSESKVVESDAPEQTETQKAMVETFKKMKEEKVVELQSRIEHQEKELKRFEFEKAQAEKKIDTAKEEVKVLESRMDSLRPVLDPNGYIFNVSEQKNEKVVLEDNIASLIREKISKVKSINADAFMKLFESGEYHIRLGQFVEENGTKTLVEVSDFTTLPDEVKISLSKIGVAHGDGKLVYVGELNWHDLVNKMIKAGFVQETEFEKICGSNSYSIGSEPETTEGKILQSVKQSVDSMETKTIEEVEEMIKRKNENMTKEFKSKTLVEFDTPTDIVVIGLDDDDAASIKKIDITDDETGFEVYQDGKPKFSLSSMGFASVMTLKEYQKLYKLKSDEMEETAGIVDGVVIPDFIGAIGISALDYDGVYHSDISLDDYDYIQHQFDDGCDVIINIPDGFDIFKLNQDLSVPTAALRGIKIDKVIK